jgi:hypothetical protein
MKSLGQKIKQCGGLIGTPDVSEWEGNFLESVLERSGDGADTTRLSEKQVEVVERIYSKHFA